MSTERTSSAEPSTHVNTKQTDGMSADFPQRYIDLPSGKVSYIEAGQGETLLLLHGGYGSWKHWCANIDALARHFHVVAIDMPSFGKSDSLPGTLTIAALADATSDAINRIMKNSKGIGASTTYSILAFSFGVTVAVQLAMNHPENVTALLLLSPPGVMPVPDELLNIQSQASKLASREGFMAGVHLTAHETMLWDKALIDDNVIEIIATGVRQCRAKTRDLSRAMPTLQLLESLVMPVRVLYGEHDPFYRSRLEEFLDCTRKAVGELGADFVKDCSHWIQYEKPELILQETIRLLKPQTRVRKETS